MTARFDAPAEAIAGWVGSESPAFTSSELTQTAHELRHRAIIVIDPSTGARGVATGGSLVDAGAPGSWPVTAVLPSMYPEWLGDRSFTEAHGTRFPYVSGAMANGIATTQLVVAMANAGCLGFFGAAGLAQDRIEVAVDELIATLDPSGLPWGCNLIHSPQEPVLEASVAEMYVAKGVRRVSAAAYMALTPAIVHYASSGIYVDANGQVQRPNMVFAKISRPEVARHFMSPPPAAMLDALVAESKLTTSEAQLAATLPVAEDITVESDSGGHTDNRPLGPLFSVIQSLRDEVVAAHAYQRPIRVGAAGGMGTPQAVASAFALGASYVLTGTVNEACVESGVSVDAKQMLATAGIADITMAPAADMFELGVDLQVLKRGTMFAPRAKKLYELYRTYASLDDIPHDDVDTLEKKILGMTVADCWASTREFWMDRDPGQVERAESDPRHKMALTFRSYLGQSSRWAITGQADRQLDYQIWCGPAMGAFNEWTAGSFLADPQHRTVAQVAMNLLEGAAVITRAHQLRTFGVAISPTTFDFRPRPLDAALSD